MRAVADRELARIRCLGGAVDRDGRAVGARSSAPVIDRHVDYPRLAEPALGVRGGREGADAGARCGQVDVDDALGHVGHVACVVERPRADDVLALGHFAAVTRP